jgi:aryl-alcohol dehydrogenase-like predicted oxidoreductase
MIYKDNSSLNQSMPVITFGGASLSGEGGGYGFGEMSEKDAETLIKSALEAGISIFDTAPIYGFGLSEERLGRYLPADAMVISKSGVDWHSTKRVNMSNSPEITSRMLHESLRRLKRDMIDIYMIHWPDPKIDIRTPLEVLKKAQDEGKIRWIGLCNTNLTDLKKAWEICDIKVLQSELNLFNQKAFDDLGDLWKDKWTMGWGTFDKGILSGRVTAKRKFTKEDARSWAPWWNKKEVQKKIERTNELRLILGDYNISLPEFCIHYNLYYYGISSTLVGFKSVSDVVHVTSNLQPKLMRERMKEILDRWNYRS